MRQLTVYIFGLLLLTTSCGQTDSKQSRELVPNPEGNKKDTFVTADSDHCKFDKYLHDIKTSKLAKNIFADSDWNLNNGNEALALLDSLTATDRQSRPFYFKVVTKTYKKSDGYFSEGLGSSGKRFVEANTKEFLNYFADSSCFTDTDLKTWTSIVMLELSLTGDNTPDKKIADKYIQVLNNNCNDCSADQNNILSKFTDNLKKEWTEYLKRVDR